LRKPLECAGKAAERSDDGALGWSEERRQFEIGVALRLPPHSKTLSAFRRFMESLNLQDWTRIGAMNPKMHKLLICRASVLRFMESLNLQDWTRIGAMNPKMRKLLICRRAS
jgi:hypothetical protein